MTVRGLVSQHSPQPKSFKAVRSLVSQHNPQPQSSPCLCVAWFHSTAHSPSPPYGCAGPGFTHSPQPKSFPWLCEAWFHSTAHSMAVRGLVSQNSPQSTPWLCGAWFHRTAHSPLHGCVEPRFTEQPTHNPTPSPTTTRRLSPIPSNTRLFVTPSPIVPLQVPTLASQRPNTHTLTHTRTHTHTHMNTHT